MQNAIARLPENLVTSAVETALAEDSTWGDVTSDALLPEGATAGLGIRMKSEGVICGLPLAEAVFRRVDPSLRWDQTAHDGDRLPAGSLAATLSGEARHLLRGERIALNFLQHLSGISTLTTAFVARARLGSQNAIIVDTRKTTPGLRALEKYAVRMGGGVNHRFGLSDGILVKDNHLAVLRKTGTPLSEALRQLRAKVPHLYRIEVEVETIEQARDAIAAGADVLLLDNMTTTKMREVVDLAAGRVLSEASGNMTLDRVAEVAASGVDFISVGALTHSAPALDISLDFMA